MSVDTLLAAVQAAVAIPEPSELALRYHRTGNALWILNTLIGFAIPAALLWFGWSARLRDIARRIRRRSSSPGPPVRTRRASCWAR